MLNAPTTPKTTQEWEQLAQARITVLGVCFIDNRHNWQPTPITGKQQCSVCHTFGYCPGCFPIIPSRGRLVCCPIHQEFMA
jgi:hypothetical protein